MNFPKHSTFPKEFPPFNKTEMLEIFIKRENSRKALKNRPKIDDEFSLSLFFL